MAAKTGYGRTVLNVQRKGSPNDGTSYRKTARPVSAKVREIEWVANKNQTDYVILNNENNKNQ